jgi:hypothetical protein
MSVGDGGLSAEGIRGTLIAVDDSARTLALITQYGAEMSFRLSGRAAAHLCHLRPGQEVMVRHSLDLRGAGELTAMGLSFAPA